MKYAHKNLLDIEKQTQLLENNLEDHPYFDPKYT
jgi:hypothetical protein